MTASGGNLTTQYNLRWSDDLKEKVVNASKENSRSINQEIVARLESSFENKNDTTITQIVDVELLFLGSAIHTLSLEDDEVQSLIIQCPVGQIPNKGDIIKVGALIHSEEMFEVKYRMYDVSFDGEHGYSLVLDTVDRDLGF